MRCRENCGFCDSAAAAPLLACSVMALAFLNVEVSSGVLQQGVELAGALQGIEVVTATDMGAADPDLRHRGAPGLAGHLRAHGRLAVDADLLVIRCV